MQHSNNSTGLGDLLERILDKGIVIAGDIKISLADVELLNIKIRLLVASVDKAREMGIDWWVHDPYLSSRARVPEQQAITGNAEPEPKAKAVNIQPDEVFEDSSKVLEKKEPILKRPKYRN
ncbi:gas vesicle protein [Desulfosporosinus fructosivorans]|uniref:Gas vesicle protein n=1 Tax=Desulfosporosinus fructosivorans TaxID=2018669 RepID=A0A4Z0QY18_9FIRM|nr:gas vesicle protein [Desulfosporosinus fructosivorans]